MRKIKVSKEVAENFRRMREAAWKSQLPSIDNAYALMWLLYYKQTKHREYLSEAGLDPFLVYQLASQKVKEYPQQATRTPDDVKYGDDLLAAIKEMEAGCKENDRVRVAQIPDLLAALLPTLEGLDQQAVARAVAALRQKGRQMSMPRAEQERSLPESLRGLLTDLTERAQQGALDPLVGRDREISYLMAVLCRRSKRNPLLIGPPGVGKTALVEGLAQRIAAGKVPSFLMNKRVLSLDIAAVVSGTTLRGQFEQRMTDLVSYLESPAGQDVILFIDEIHMLIGAGDMTKQMDAANILKPALARGKLALIGATTEDEYRNCIAPDGAFDRRFTVIQVDEPKPKVAVEMIKQVRPLYEQHHGIKITDDAIGEAVRLTTCYIHDRYLPDKALDVLDEAASEVAMSLGRCAKDEDADSGEWLEIPQIEEEDREEARAIEAEDVVRVMERRTGIPAQRLRLRRDERLRLLHATLAHAVLGQGEAQEDLTAVLARMGGDGNMDVYNRPAMLIFAGPLGCGKKTTARAVAKEMCDDEQAMHAFNASELTRLAFHDELYESMRRSPRCVLLFEDIDQSPLEVQHTVAGLVKRGQVRNSAGAIASLSQAIVIATVQLDEKFYRNRSLSFLRQDAQDGRLTDEEAKAALSQRLSQRLLELADGVIVFAPLSEEIMKIIAEREIAQMSEALRTHGIQLSVTKAAQGALLKAAASLQRGAGGIKAVLDEKLRPLMASAITDDRQTEMIYIMDERDGKLVIERAQAQTPSYGYLLS